MSQKVDENKVRVEIPDARWLATLTDQQYELVKKRYADFTTFTFKQMMKLVARVGIYQTEEFADAITTEIVEEMSRDKSLPSTLRKALKEELKSKKGEP